MTNVPDQVLSGRDNRMDVARIGEDVGFVAQFDLASGLRDHFEWRESGFTE